MLNFGFWEILVVLILALVVVGPERLPEMVRFLGRQYGKLMRASDELRRAFVLEADRNDLEKRADEMRARRQAALERARAARARAQEKRLQGGSTVAPTPPSGEAVADPTPVPVPAHTPDVGSGDDS